MKNFRAGFALLLLSMSLVRCQRQQPSLDSIYSNTLSTAIVGGQIVSENSVLLRSMVYIYSETSENIPQNCSGTFIAKNLILTAAHCVQTGLNNVSLTQGAYPLSENQNDQIVRDLTPVNIYIHPNYSKEKAKSSSVRYDLAIIQVSEESDSFLTLYQPKVTTLKSKNLKKYTPTYLDYAEISMLGYGQVHGLEESMEPTEEGILRRVDIKILSAINLSIDHFILDQTNGNGVCFGDSGGPSLIKENGHYFLIGVSSAVLDDTKTAAQLINQKDLCKRKSLVMNVIPYLDWVHFIGNTTVTGP